MILNYKCTYLVFPKPALIEFCLTSFTIPSFSSSVNKAGTIPTISILLIVSKKPLKANVHILFFYKNQGFLVL